MAQTDGQTDDYCLIDINKIEVVDAILALAVKEGWMYQVSITDNKLDLTKEKKITLETIDSEELLGKRWIRLYDGLGQAIQLNISEM